MIFYYPYSSVQVCNNLNIFTVMYYLAQADTMLISVNVQLYLCRKESGAVEPPLLGHREVLMSTLLGSHPIELPPLAHQFLL